MKALLIHPDGRVERNDLPTDQHLTAAVGGFYQAFPLTDGADAWCNEDGKATGLPYNLQATRLCHHFQAVVPDDWIVGTLVVTGGADEEGDTLDVPEAVVTAIQQVLS